MPRSIKRPQTGSPVWYYANPAPAAPQAAVVCQTVSWSDATETGSFNLYVLSGSAVASAALGVAYTQAGAPGQVVTAATIAAGGAGYVVGDQVTLSNGVVLQVATVTAGAITGSLTVVKGGLSMTASPPANPVAQVSTTGAGTGGTFTLTWSSGAWCTYPRAYESTSSLQPSSMDMAHTSEVLAAAATAAAAPVAGGGSSAVATAIDAGLSEQDAAPMLPPNRALPHRSGSRGTHR